MIVRIIFLLLMAFPVELLAQNSIALINKNNQRVVEQINIGDVLSVKLKNGEQIKSEVMDLTQTEFILQDRTVPFTAIKKFRKEKKRTAQIIAGSGLVVGGAVLFAVFANGEVNFDYNPLYAASAIAITTVGVAMIVPKWFKFKKRYSVMLVQA